MLNIAFIHEEFPKGGGEQVTMYLSSYLKSPDYKLYVFVYKLNKEKLPANVSAIEYIKLPFSIWDARNADFIASHIKSKEIVIFVSPGFMLSYISSIKEKGGCKIVFISHNPPFWEIKFKAENGKHNAERSFAKWLEWYLLRSIKYRLKIVDRAVKRKYRKIYESVDVFGVLCEEYGRIISSGIGIDYSDSKFITLTNPTVIEGRDMSIPKAKEILYVGRLTYADKRVDRLFAAWKLIQDDFPKWDLVIVGDGAESAALRKMAERLALKRVRFCGYTNDVGRYYQRAEIVCLTSTIEAWGLSLTEGQSYGCAAIAFDCSAGVREILTFSNICGILVKPFDVSEYAEKLALLMSNDSMRKEIQFNALERVKAFSLEHISMQWRSMITKLSLRDGA